MCACQTQLQGLGALPGYAKLNVTSGDVLRKAFAPQQSAEPEGSLSIPIVVGIAAVVGLTGWFLLRK
jgi:hypothetical protein